MNSRSLKLFCLTLLIAATSIPQCVIRFHETYATQDYVYPSNVGYFNVKNSPYNCFGDGVHDDTACIQAAMKAGFLTSGTGGRYATVYFPSGTYLISDTLLFGTFGTSTATITANMNLVNGCITGINIVAAGSGYAASNNAVHGEPNPGPGLYMTGGGGSRQELYVDRNTSTGAISGPLQTGVNNESASSGCYGKGYTSTPTITVVNWKAYLRFEGQNKATTKIRLTDNNSKFQNTNCNISVHGDTALREYCRAMIFSAGEGEPDSNSLTERAYDNDIWNLTIDTGVGNPGAIAIDWIGSNRASIKNVNIKSEDFHGRAGLNVSRGSGSGPGTGPAYVKNVGISGFDYGVYALTGQERLGNTFEYMDFYHIGTAGVINGNMPNWFRNIYADINVPVFIDRAAGGMVLTDATFEGGLAGTSAVEAQATSSGGVVFLRNISATGNYQSALATGSGNTMVPGSSVSEFTFPAKTSQFTTTRNTSLNLTGIPNTPEFIDNNFADWEDVSAHGANCQPNANLDATSCIQAALNAGNPIVYFPFGYYWTSATLHVPSTVRVILGDNSYFASSTGPGQTPNDDGAHRSNFCIWSFESTGTNPVEFRNTTFDVQTQPSSSTVGTVCHAAAAPLVVADSLDGVGFIVQSASTGDVYIENVAYPNATFTLDPTQHVYARQYDVENGSATHVSINDGIFWMFGYKTEGSGLLWTATNSTFELIGAFNLAQGSPVSIAYQFINCLFSIEGITATSGGWTNQVSEQQGATTHNQATNGQWNSGIGLGLYVGQN